MNMLRFGILMAIACLATILASKSLPPSAEAATVTASAVQVPAPAGIKS